MDKQTKTSHQNEIKEESPKSKIAQILTGEGF